MNKRGVDKHNIAVGVLSVIIIIVLGIIASYIYYLYSLENAFLEKNSSTLNNELANSKIMNQNISKAINSSIIGNGNAGSGISADSSSGQSASAGTSSSFEGSLDYISSFENGYSLSNGAGNETVNNTGNALLYVAVCGNGVIDSGEECDGSNLNVRNCSGFNDSVGDYFDGGNLGCSSDCKFNLTRCSLNNCGWLTRYCAYDGLCKSPFQSCCVPKATCINGQQCGTQSDGCTGTISCGSCGTNQICSSGQCQNLCSPRTSCINAQQCGTQSDGCTGTISCGSCASGQTCNATGKCQSIVVPSCVSNWTCTSWSSCSNSIQTRTCRDTNNCQTPVNSPSLSQSCVNANSWPPSWLSSIDNLISPSSWTSIGGFGCNSVSFGTSPVLGDIYIGRNLNRHCDGTSALSLVYVFMNWSSTSLQQKRVLIDTSLGAISLSDGNQITNAYDASVMVWNNEIWVAFECYGYPNFQHQGASGCVGPLNKDMSLNLSRTVAVIGGTSFNPNDVYGRSASVPKLLVHKGIPYIYWSVVKYLKSDPNAGVDVTSRGVELAQESGGLRRLWAKVNGQPKGSYLASDDPASVEVFGVNLSDTNSNKAADLFYTVSDDNYIYFTGGRGGDGCLLTTGGINIWANGCYRLTIGRATNPLGYHAFNENLISDNYLPQNPQEYYHFVYRPNDGRTVLIGGNFLNMLNNPSLNSGTKFFVWKDNLLSNIQVPAGYQIQNVYSPVTISIPSSADSFVEYLYQCTLGRLADSGGKAAYIQYLSSSSATAYNTYSSFFQSTEYSNQQRSNFNYMNQMYRCILFRYPDNAGSQDSSYTSILDSGNLNRSQVLNNFLNSEEFKYIVWPQLKAKTGLNSIF